MKLHLSAALGCFLACEAATAQEVSIVAEGVAATSFIDRGEHISGPGFEAGIAVGTAFAGGEIYGALYRLTPVGDDQAAFADEFDYTVGYAFEGDGYAADVSANWLTFPGSNDEASLELAGELVLDESLTPTLIGFYDVDLEDWGLEFNIGPSWEAGVWSGYTIGRLGIVNPGDGSDGRPYYGVETGLARPLSKAAEIGGFARFEASDQDTFADEITNGEILSTQDNGLSIGIYLAFAR